MKRFLLILLAIFLLPSLAWAQPVNHVLEDPGMEAGSGSTPTYWVAGNLGNACVWDNTVSHSGSHSLKVQGYWAGIGIGSPNPAYGWRQDFSVSPNTKYSLGVWVKTQSNNSPAWEDDINPDSLMIDISTWAAGYENPNRSLYGVETAGFRTMGWQFIPMGDVVTLPTDAIMRVSLSVQYILPNKWQASRGYGVGTEIIPTTFVAGGNFYRCSAAGTTGSTQPSWPTTIGGIVNDGSVTWTCVAPDNSAAWFDDVVCVATPWAGVVRPTQLFQKSASSVVWSEHQNADVLQTDAAPSGSVPSNPLQLLTAVQGERTAFQLVVQPLGSAMSSVSITQGLWSGPAAFPGSVEVDHVLYVHQPAATAYSYDRGGLIPEPMPVEPNVTLAAGVNSPFMVNVDVPLGTVPGVYNTTFSVVNNGATIATVPVQLTVMRTSIPANPTFWNIGNWNSGSIFAFEDPHNNLNHTTILENYINNCKTYRCNPGGAFTGFETFGSKSDFTDRLVGGVPTLGGMTRPKALWAYMASKGMLGWPVRGDMGQDGNGSLQPLGLNYSPRFTDVTNTQLTSGFKSVATAQLQAIHAARAAQGCGPWLYYIADEGPPPADTPAMNSLVAQMNFMRSVDPTIRFCMANKPYPMLTAITDFIAHPDYQPLWTDQDKQLMSQNMAGIYPNAWAGPSRATIKYRLWPWGEWNAGYRGVIWWTVADWNSSPGLSNPWEGNIIGPTMVYPPRTTIVVRGTLSPKVAGTYSYTGMAKGRPYYQLGGEYLSSDGTNWYISNAIGGAGSGAYWENTTVPAGYGYRYPSSIGSSWVAGGGAAGTPATAIGTPIESGPISSTRWAAFRQGLQDVELFQKLQTLINNLQGIASSTDLTNAAKALAAVGTTVTHFPQAMDPTFDEFGIYDYAAIETVRTNVINSIITLEGYTGAHPQTKKLSMQLK
jgi:hypothetical protein